MNLRKPALHTVAATTIGVLALGVGSVGIATAANGGSLVLGGHNSATKTTVLKDKKGTPLALIGKKGKPPLTVNSSGLVKHLNAAEVGGLAANLLSSGSSVGIKVSPQTLAEALLGGGGSTDIDAVALPAPNTSGSSPIYSPVKVMSTATLPKGTYQINATFGAILSVCWVGDAGNINPEPATLAYIFSGNVATTVTLKKAGAVNAYCEGINPSTSGPGGYFVTGGINATRMVSIKPGTHAPLTPTAVSTLRRAR